MYLQNEPFRVRAAILNPGCDFGDVVASIERADRPVAPIEVVLVESEGAWEATVPGLGEGLYKVEVKTTAPYPVGPPPVHDVFYVEG